MKAKLTITNQTTTKLIKPYSEDIIATELHTATLNVGKKSMDFYDFQDNSLNDLLSLLKEENELEITHDTFSLNFPKDIAQKILWYLQFPQLKQHVNCHAFVEGCRAVLQKALQIVAKEYDPNENYEPGAISHVQNGLISIHSQLYLGNDLFLSKGGNQGPLIISTADQMEKLWGGNKTIIEIQNNQ